MRWAIKKILAVVAVVLFFIFAIAGILHANEPTTLACTERVVEVDNGENLWDICKREAGESVDVRRVVYDTARRNDISRDAIIQPGEKIVVVIRR